MTALKVRLLGDLQVEGFDGAGLERRQLRTLLKILALAAGRPVPAERLVDCLWGDDPPTKAADQISVLVSRLRRAVGADRLLRTDAGYALVVDWLDVAALADYADEAERRLAEGAVGAARAAAGAGLSLVRGPLLADEPDPRWADAERAAAARTITRLHHAGVAGAAAAHDWTAAADLAARVRDSDPYDEVALRALMEALARSGRSASALAVYAEARTRLTDDLGVSPSAPTEALHAAILLEELVADDADAPTASPGPALPGRGAAIAELDAWMARAIEGHGGIGIVEGEAGIGKSRLLREWSARVGVTTTVVSVQCDELGRSLPLQPLIDAVADLIRGNDDGLGPDTNLLGPLLGLPAATVPASPTELAALMGSDAGQSLLSAAIMNVLRRHADQAPLVVIIDDVHFADDATLTWLAHAARRLADARLLIVAARRAEEGTAIPHAEVLRLGPLDRAATEEVVGPERAAAMFERTGGHPLFLVELAAGDAEASLPETLVDAVDERCGRAGPAAATIRAAAVIGSDIDLDLVAAATSTTVADLLDHLEEGVRRRLVVDRDGGFVFTHSLVREALAAAVTASRSAYIHREASRALAARPDADPLIVAHHARLGGDTTRAAAMLVEAARVAVTRFDQRRSLELLDEAIALDDTLDARLERARVASMLGLYDRTADDLDAARAKGGGPEVLEAGAWAAHFQRRFRDALRLADEGVVQATDPDLRASCLALGGWVSLASGDLTGAADRLERAVGDEGATTGPLASAWLAWLRTNQGRPDDALRLARPDTGHGLAAYRFPNAYALMAATMALAMLGRADEALATADELATDVARMGAERWAPRPLNLKGWVLTNLGETSRADDLHRAAIELARPQALAEPITNSLLDLAAAHLLRGDADGADRLLGEAADANAVEHAFQWRHQLRARLLRARLDLLREDTDAAATGAETLATDAAQLGVRRCEVQARLVAATAAYRAGEKVNKTATAKLLDALDGVAGIESWWITADVARAFAMPRWRSLAETRIAAQLTRAGPYTATLEREAARRLA